MGHIQSFLGRRAYRWLIIGLTIVAFTGLAFAQNRVWGHEAHSGAWRVGEMYPVSGVCNARGASRVAQANLREGTLRAGNAEVTRLASAALPSCFGWGAPIMVTAREVTYIGTTAGLHVYIIKFSESMFVVGGMRRAPIKNPAELSI